MIFDTLRDGIVARLNGDAYFSVAPAVTVIAEEDSLDDGTVNTVRDRLQDALNSSGVCAVVGEVDIDQEAGGPFSLYMVTLPVVFFENREKNRDATEGSRKTCKNATSKAHALLQRHVIPISDLSGERVDPFTPLNVIRVDYVGEDNGIIVREMTVTTRIAVDILQYALANEGSFALVTETGQPLIISPTTP